MVLFLIFILFLLLENLLLPALLGPKDFLIVPLFLMALLTHGKNYKKSLILALGCLLIAEIFSGIDSGSYLIPFSITAVLFIWLNRFLDMSSGLRENHSFSCLVLGGLTISFFIAIYSWIFIFLNSSYSLVSSWSDWWLFIKTSSTEILAWSFALTFL